MSNTFSWTFQIAISPPSCSVLARNSFFPHGLPQKVADRLRRPNILWPLDLNPLPFTLSLTYVQELDRQVWRQSSKQSSTKGNRIAQHRFGASWDGSCMIIAQGHGSRCHDGWVSLIRHDSRHAAMYIFLVRTVQEVGKKTFPLREPNLLLLS